MNDVVIGAKILDVLTVGMYPDALDAIREYIQNSFDAIRQAEANGVLGPNQGSVVVAIDPDRRRISIRDNGIGVPAAQARTTLLSIGASRKIVGVNAGFRGIGRLAGLAYCDKLVFRTAYKDEPRQTELVFNAAEIRKGISVSSTDARDETAVDILEKLTKLRQFDADNTGSFFEVDLIDINPKASPFLDVEKVRDYLRQVAPVEFDTQAFVYGHSIINPFLKQFGAHRTINLELRVNDRREAIKKPYRTFHRAGSGKNNRVEIKDIDTFRDPVDPPRWIAWISRSQDLRGTINDEDVRGIRLRSSNILIGDYRTFSRVFEKVQKSYARFNGWYSGEVHILDSRIIPNSRRDFFEDNDAWQAAEKTLIERADPLIRRAYQNSDERNRDFDSIQHDAEQAVVAAKKKAARGFASDDNRSDAVNELKKQEQRIERAKSGDRTEDELDALNKRKDEVEAVRKELEEKPRPLIDESVLDRDERKIVRLIMDVVNQICGADLAEKTAVEVDRRLKARKNQLKQHYTQGPTRAGSAGQSAREHEDRHIDGTPLS